MRIFVTGGTGLLGNTVLRQLTEQGHQLISLVRGEPDPDVFGGIETEFARGDINDKHVIQSAVDGCDAVIHSAALIHIGWSRLKESTRVNVGGTRTVVDACCRFGVPLVHVGTVDTLGLGSRDVIADETTEFDAGEPPILCSYVVSKLDGVREVIAGVDRKLRCVIVHPGFMIGPWDWKPSSGRMIVEVSKVWRPIAPSGGGSMCDSRDVAAGTISAMHRMLDLQIPADGRQYVLGGENWTYFEYWKEIATRTGVRPPIMPAGPAQRWIGSVAGDVISRFSKQESDLNSAAVRMGSQFHWYDSSRAKSELGYRWRDPNESLDDAIQWLRSRGMIRR